LVRRLGQANIVGALLLLVIVVSMWCLVWIWIYPTLELFKEYYPEPRLKELSYEHLIIEDVWVRGDECIVYVYNAGEIEITLSAIYINHIQVWKGQMKLEVGEGVSLVLKVPPGEGDVKTLKVVTLRGGEYYWGG